MQTGAMLVMLDRAMIIMRRITGSVRIVIMAGVLLRMHGKHRLARIRREHAPLQAGQYAEHRKPCENQFHQVRGTWQ